MSIMMFCALTNKEFTVAVFGAATITEAKK